MLRKRIARVLCVGVLAAASQACVTYTGVTKDNKGQVYLTGATSFLVFGKSWVKRCDEVDKELACKELHVEEGSVPHRASSNFDTLEASGAAVEHTTPQLPLTVDPRACPDMVEKICTCPSKFPVETRRAICDQARSTFENYRNDRNDAGRCVESMRRMLSIAKCVP